MIKSNMFNSADIDQIPVQQTNSTNDNLEKIKQSVDDCVDDCVDDYTNNETQYSFDPLKLAYNAGVLASGVVLLCVGASVELPVSLIFEFSGEITNEITKEIGSDVCDNALGKIYKTGPLYVKHNGMLLENYGTNLIKSVLYSEKLDNKPLSSITCFDIFHNHQIYNMKQELDEVLTRWS